VFGGGYLEVVWGVKLQEKRGVTEGSGGEERREEKMQEEELVFQGERIVRRRWTGPRKALLSTQASKYDNKCLGRGWDLSSRVQL
jgi:hypothetical protein